VRAPVSAPTLNLTPPPYPLPGTARRPARPAGAACATARGTECSPPAPPAPTSPAVPHGPRAPRSQQEPLGLPRGTASPRHRRCDMETGALSCDASGLRQTATSRPRPEHLRRGSSRAAQPAGPPASTSTPLGPLPMRAAQTSGPAGAAAWRRGRSARAPPVLPRAALPRRSRMPRSRPREPLCGSAVRGSAGGAGALRPRAKPGGAGGARRAAQRAWAAAQRRTCRGWSGRWAARRRCQNDAGPRGGWSSSLGGCPRRT